MRCVQIVPQSAGGVAGGVSAYALALAGHFELEFGIAQETLTHCDSEGNLHTNAETLAAGDVILLHYVGYGYQPRGVPLRLAMAWEGIRREYPDLRLGVAFHEVYAFGPPWRSSFWLLPFQRWIARRLLRTADVAFTTLERYRGLLRSLDVNHPVESLPIPSTVGEPELVPEYEDRAARLVVFGSSGVRARAWRTEGAALAAAVRALAVEEVVDIGAPCSRIPSIAGVPVREAGVLPDSAVTAELSQARAGFIAYPPDYVDKSTIYGAYLAHGLIPILAWSGPRGRAPRAGESWIRATASGVDLDLELPAIASRALQSYAERAVARHAEMWKERLFRR